MIVVPLAVWLGNALVAASRAGDRVSVWSPYFAAAAALIALGWLPLRARRMLAADIRAGAQRAATVLLALEQARARLACAHRNLIEKFLAPRALKYWVVESIWGHLNGTDWPPDDKDNIMLTGRTGLLPAPVV